MTDSDGHKLKCDTESSILAAAEREFLTKGFAGARTTSIAEAAGVTHAMLHYYFRTKEKLFGHIISEKISLLKDALLAPLEIPGLTLAETIKTLIERHLDFIAANPELPRFIVSEISRNPENAAIFQEQLKLYAPKLLDRLQEKIDRAADEGSCRRVDARGLIIDIASLNLFSFMAYPIVNSLLDGYMSDTAAFVELRKKENYDTIMRKLHP